MNETLYGNAHHSSVGVPIASYTYLTLFIYLRVGTLLSTKPTTEII